METGIPQVVDELIEKYGSNLNDAARTNELRAELTFSLRGLAKRIDIGYQIEVRGGLPPPTEEEGEEDEEDAAANEARRTYEEIAGRQEQLRFMKLEGPPILGLEEPEPEEPKPDSEDAPIVS